MDAYYKTPRLYLNSSFSPYGVLALEERQVHYLKNVLRKGACDVVRVFNGADGEWLARIQDLKKKVGTLVLEERIRAQPPVERSVTLYFAPIQKARMDVLVEKAVELGVSALVPVITNRTEHRKINENRLRTQIIEASEQCERLDIPELHGARMFHACLHEDICVCLERSEETRPIHMYDFSDGASFMIGPVGGFDEMEREMLYASDNVHLVSLGERVLRCETAAMAALSYVLLS